MSRVGVGMYSIDCCHEFFDAVCPWTGWVLQCLDKREPRMTGMSSPGYSYSLRSSRISISTRSRSSSSSDEVALVHEYDDVRYAYLTSEQDVFAGLCIGPSSCRYNEDCTVHLSSTGDHVLNIVGVPWAVYVCIVTGVGFIFERARC